MATPWWVDRPGTLHQELAGLKRAGIDYQVREDLKAQGILQINATVDVGGEQVEVEVVYPDLFPYVRFEIYAPKLDLERHQNPFGKNLCLLARGTENWDIDDTAADFLKNRLPMVLAAARAPAGSSPVPEVPQGEPRSFFYPTQPGAAILIDSAWHVPTEVDRGWLKIYLDEPPVGLLTPGGLEAPVVRGVVAEIKDAGHHVLAFADPGMLQPVSNPVTVSARWLRLDPPPPIDSGEHPFASFSAAVDNAWGSAGTSSQYGKYRLEITAVLFSEEVAEATEGDGWLFRIRALGRKKAPDITYFARAQRAGRDDLVARVPELSGLREKTVLFFGVGGVGAPAALELARAGVGELRLVDHDSIDAGTAVRYPFGLASAGMPKVHAIAGWINRNLPYTIVKPYETRIGDVRRSPEQRPELDLLDELFAGVDIVVDATAERGLHHLISDLARQHGVPYVEAATRTGARGGVLARIGAGENDPCWLCYEYFLDELSERTPPIAPSADPLGNTQPLGCADPTFTGAGFDVAAYGLALARLVAGTLLDGFDERYPSPEWDIAIYNVRDSVGSLQPSWQTWPLGSHPNCPKHGV